MSLSIPIIGTRFAGNHQYGDFYWMCRQPEYANALYIFNDDEEAFDTCKRGGGNAIMRQYNRHSNLVVPISAGIPTGSLTDGGYDELTEHVKEVVGVAIAEIRVLLSENEYDAIYYSVGANGKLGTGIFDVAPEVIDYIDAEINGVLVPLEN